jgi:dTDP-4-amino-4,6-dideoxygalactose transaminase
LTRLEGIVARRNALGRRLTGALSAVHGLTPMSVREGDDSSYWFFFFRLDSRHIRTDRATFVNALQAEGVQAGAGYIPMPVHRYRVFQNHAFFGGRWPLREHGMTTMDYRKVTCPQAEQFLGEAVTLPLKEHMDEDYIDAVGRAIAKVARHYAR